MVRVGERENAVQTRARAQQARDLLLAERSEDTHRRTRGGIEGGGPRQAGPGGSRVGQPRALGGGGVGAHDGGRGMEAMKGKKGRVFLGGNLRRTAGAFRHSTPS